MRMSSHPSRRLFRNAASILVVVAVVLLVVATGPAHFALHLDGGQADCVACHLAATDVFVGWVPGDALAEAVGAQGAPAQVIITSATWDSIAPSAPPVI